MSNCCTSQTRPSATAESSTCPVSSTKGKRIGLNTLKSLLAPQALAKLDPNVQHFFCPDSNCDVVYFSSERTYGTRDVKVAVFQKDSGPDVPACYCFGWTRAALADAVARGNGEAAPTSITAHVEVGRCGCELNNPQGSCCLGNVHKALKALNQEAVEVA
jgi:hypothetical protein